ncbi:hypothetical protein JOQ06_019070 [Pogonophryne albipinna]|uniref:Uncharacterized protein n=1 Tax=Pogonophryne albipinna TaxID=1090488 RepID=A0AAD6FCZ5_9TELE|nr:hypothetical protein JOQ06_019070 [Pogonophryne albipinna]
MALEEEHLEETRQRETEWQTQHKVLEGQIECELATKEILKTSEQKQSREVEEKWLNKEEEWLNKEREMRDAAPEPEKCSTAVFVRFTPLALIQKIHKGYESQLMERRGEELFLL